MAIISSQDSKRKETIKSDITSWENSLSSFQIKSNELMLSGVNKVLNEGKSPEILDRVKDILLKTFNEQVLLYEKFMNCKNQLLNGIEKNQQKWSQILLDKNMEMQLNLLTLEKQTLEGLFQEKQKELNLEQTEKNFINDQLNAIKISYEKVSKHNLDAQEQASKLAVDLLTSQEAFKSELNRKDQIIINQGRIIAEKDQIIIRQIANIQYNQQIIQNQTINIQNLRQENGFLLQLIQKYAPNIKFTGSY